MKNYILSISLLLVFICNVYSQKTNSTYFERSTVISQPVLIEDDDWRFEGTENMMLVPENRNDPKSRMIPVHFFRFPTKEKTNLPPVAFLGAGPGEPYSVEVFFQGKRAEAWRFELQLVNQKRDVILINQRGNSGAPGLQIKDFRYRWSNGGTLDQAFDAQKKDANRKAAYTQAIKTFQEKGVDLKGYDIIHFVDDIEAVRRHLEVDKLALMGNSFGSQWGLGYIQRYPDHVDRAIFSGVEPLDHNYDDPQGLWAILERIDAYAKADPTLKNQIPEKGFVAIFKTIIERLEAKPFAVNVTNDEGEKETIVVGIDDLRLMYMNPAARSYIEEIESWPAYIMDVYNNEDYRLLAEYVRGRIYNSSSRMINPLFNNSLGISKEREEELNNRPAKRWLGDINSHYTTTRDICPAPKVDPAFRQHVRHNIPMILIQGDLDASTPYENATFLMDYLENGHLITVKRGFHNAKRAMIFDNPDLVKKVYSFMDQDFKQVDFQDFKSDLPTVYELSKFNFWPITDGESLYEKLKNK
ncbi:MAG: alpha/beta hydrolase [Bacteroidota bacterium]